METLKILMLGKRPNCTIRSIAMTDTDQRLPTATPALARALWNRLKNPSARRVATQLTQSGRCVHFTTIARWRRQGWKATEPMQHPLEAVRMALETAMPVVTNDPMMRTQDLLDSDAKKKFALLTDEDLLRKGARDTLILINLIFDEALPHAWKLMGRPPGQLAALLSALAGALNAAGAACSQVVEMQERSTRKKSTICE